MSRMDDETCMGWLALRVLNLVQAGGIELPSDLNSIRVDDEIVEDVGFAVANIYTPEEIVEFFRKLPEFAAPFDSDEDYKAYHNRELESSMGEESLTAECDDEKDVF